MAKIFISYRRADSTAITGRIYDRLVTAFGDENVFKDVNDIAVGLDFRGVLREAAAQCNVMLVVIGSQWVSIKDNVGRRRLDDSNDFVRLEVETGLQRDGVLVIPLLVSGALPPRADDLPDELKQLAYRNAYTIHDDPDFHRDMDRLIEQLTPRVIEGAAANVVQPVDPEIKGATRKTAKEQSGCFRIEVSVAIITGVFVLLAAGIALIPSMLERIDNVATQDALNRLNTQTQAAQYMTETAVALMTASVGTSQSPTVAVSTATVPDPSANATMSAAPTMQIIAPPTTTALLTSTSAPLIDATVIQPTLTAVAAAQCGLVPDLMICVAAPDVPPFAIDITEITRASFVSFATDPKNIREPDARNRLLGVAGSATHTNQVGRLPMTNVSYEEALQYCQSRGDGYALPTEDQWRAAAYWDPIMNRNRIYPWGDAGPNIGNFGDTLQPVKGYAPNALGLYDMAGNAAEWVSGSKDNYPTIGGDYSSDANEVRFDASVRFYTEVIPAADGAHIGFRCIWQP